MSVSVGKGATAGNMIHVEPRPGHEMMHKRGFKCDSSSRAEEGKIPSAPRNILIEVEGTPLDEGHWGGTLDLLPAGARQRCRRDAHQKRLPSF